VFFVAIYIPPQNNAGTKTTLNEVYTTIRKPEKAHPDAGVFNAETLMQRNVNTFYLISTSMLNVQPEGKRL
jgi:hypothetical protein